MLRISVVSRNGSAPSAPMFAEFSERGGGIGRDGGNVFVLPDPDKHISRVQALVKVVNGEYWLADQGSNPSSLNGRPLGKGNEHPLKDGDRIEMAEWVLGVEFISAAPSLSTRPAAAPAADPFAAMAAPAPMRTAPADDPLGLLGGSAPAAAPVRSPAPATPPAAGATVVLSPAAGVDPLAALLSTPAPALSNDDPFAVFAKPVTAPSAAPAPQAPAVDNDPFGAFGAPPAAPKAAPVTSNDAGDPLGIGISAGTGSVDTLFDLKLGSGNPLGSSLLADPMHQAPATDSAVDPLALLMGGPAEPAIAPAAQRNDAPLLDDAFKPPQAKIEPAGDILDILGGNTPSSTEPDTVITALPLVPPKKPERVEPVIPDHFANLPEPTPKAAAAPLVPDLPASDVTMVLSPSAVPKPVAPAATSKVTVDGLGTNLNNPVVAPKAPEAYAGSADAVLAAFVRGLGIDGLQPPGGFTPEFAEQVGRMLRESVQGTMELLAARAATKREVRAEVTMIVTRGNNPLKFSPDVGFALKQLLQPSGKGFLGPVDAMTDAYDDLRAHQMGFAAGMRAALAGVLKRFEPSELEGRITDKSFFDSVMPANRKAKLWNMYEQRYADIQNEATDDFHTLFGREFLRAYEEQVERLSNERGG